MSRPFSDWCDGLPERWRPRRLKYLTTCNDEVLSEDTPADLEIAYVDIGSVSSTGQIERIERLNFSGAPSRARRVVRHGDVLVSTVRTYLKAIAPVKRPPENMIASTGFAVIRCGEGTWPGYLAYALRTDGFVGHVIARSVGVSYPAINSSELGSLLIPAPPLDEQTQIAKFLDYETAKIDKLIDKQQQLIALLKEKRQAVISHAVTKGLNPDAPMKDSGVEWLGKVPAHWDTHSLKYCARAGRKMFTDGDWIESPFITDNGVRLLQTGNVGIGEFREKGYRYISEESFRQLKCTQILPGDVLVCRLDGPVGRACLVPDLGINMITSVDNAILKASSKFDPRFLVYVMTSTQWLSWIENICRVGGGFRFRVSRTMLGDQRIPAPPIDEQLRIADLLDEGRAKYDGLVQRAEEAIDLLTERRSALISAAVTGKIDVRNWRPPETDAEQEVA